jgi:hypothetical protein
MLTAEQLKPFLFHEESHVRKAVVEYFSDSWSRDPEIVPAVLQLCERYGDEANTLNLARCDHLVVTAQAADQLLALLGSTPSVLAVRHINRLLGNAPVDWLKQQEQAIRACPRAEAALLQKLERRCEWSGWSGERLWQELQDFSHRSQDEGYTSDIDLDYGWDLVEALGPHTVPDAPTLCGLLRSPAVSGSWLETFVVDLAGARGLHEAVPALVEKFHIDTDYLLERCMYALCRIGDPEASRLIGADYASAGSTFQNFSTGALEGIKHPQTEEVLLTLLETLPEAEFRTSLCLCLCKLFSEGGVEVVRGEIAAGYESFFANLEEELLPVLDVLGIDLPEAADWRKEREETERRVAQQRARLEEQGKRLAALQKQGIDPFAAPKAVPRPVPPPREADRVPPRPAGFEHTQPRVGRNDPCPCRSGKKFKHCCGRKK